MRTREALPREWAETQYNLAIAYRNRIRGEPADNLEKAIAGYEAAVTVDTRGPPARLGATQNNLANAYRLASAASPPTTWRRRSPPTRRR